MNQVGPYSLTHPGYSTKAKKLQEKTNLDKSPPVKDAYSAVCTARKSISGALSTYKPQSTVLNFGMDTLRSEGRELRYTDLQNSKSGRSMDDGVAVDREASYIFWYSIVPLMLRMLGR